MTESQRLIAELGHIQSFFEGKVGMTVGQGKMLLLNWANVARDAAAMLKEQEAVKPILLEADDGTCQLQCGDCNWFLNFGQVPQMRYCPHCGRKVKWDEAIQEA